MICELLHVKRMEEITKAIIQLMRFIIKYLYTCYIFRIFQHPAAFKNLSYGLEGGSRKDCSDSENCESPLRILTFSGKVNLRSTTGWFRFCTICLMVQDVKQTKQERVT